MVRAHDFLIGLNMAGFGQVEPLQKPRVNAGVDSPVLHWWVKTPPRGPLTFFSLTASGICFNTFKCPFKLLFLPFGHWKQLQNCIMTHDSYLKNENEFHVQGHCTSWKNTNFWLFMSGQEEFSTSEGAGMAYHGSGHPSHEFSTVFFMGCEWNYTSYD